jgi:hypothetical protein
MVTPAVDSKDDALERLQVRIAELEKQLEERSRHLRQLTRVVCDEDLMNFSRMALGMPPLPRAGFGLRGWHETTEPTHGDVDKTMKELWRSVAPPVLEDEP